VRAAVKSASFAAAHSGRDRKAIATPAANARNDSSAITGTGGRGAVLMQGGPTRRWGPHHSRVLGRLRWPENAEAASAD
jgi:hypothetical protein